MKSLFLTLSTAIFLLFIAACNNDLDITDDWKETPVVYSLLNPSSSTNYIRLQRAYLGEGNAYLMGQNSDSLYFDTNLVSVRVVRVKNFTPLDTFHLPVVTNIKKDEGVFSDAPHFLYQLNGRIFNDSRYDLYVNRHKPVGNLTINTIESTVFDPGAANRQFVVLVRNSELAEAALKDGSLLHSIGFDVMTLNGTANYTVSISAALVNGCLNPSSLPAFSTQLTNELLTLHKGWNDVFFKTPFAVSPGSDIAFRICITPQAATNAASLAFTETPGCITWTASSTCGNNTANISESRRPLLRLGYSGNGINNQITSASTDLVFPFSSQTLSTGLNINLANAEPFKIKVLSSRNGSIHSLDARFRYLERKLNSQIFEEKSVLYSLGTQTPLTTNGSEQLEFLMKGEAFFQFLGSKIPFDPSVTRPSNATKIDFIARIGTLEFSTYYIVNQPGNSVFNQPEYSNIENGKGIFSSRLDSTRTNFQLNSPSLDSLNFGRYTGNRFD